jgi:hypothetical protein
MKNNIHDALVELYLDLKLRKLNELNLIEEAENVMEEKDGLRGKDTMTVVNYLKYSMEQFLDDKMSDGRKTTTSDQDTTNYEELLRKLEGDIRSHIRVISIKIDRTSVKVTF